MKPLYQICLVLVCVAVLMASVEASLLHWLLVRAGVIFLAAAPGMLLVAAGAGYGLWMLPAEGLSKLERAIFAFACGIGVLSTLAFAAGMTVLTQGTALLVTGGGLLAGGLRLRPALRAWSAAGDARPALHPQAATPRGTFLITGLLAALALAMATAALTPPLIFDVTEYHLGAWTSYWNGAEARFRPMPHNFYARFPFPIEAIYFLGLALGKQVDAAPKLFNFACVLACSGLAWGLALRLGGHRRTAALAALLALAHPVMQDVSIDALIDAPMALLVAASFYGGFLCLDLPSSVTRDGAPRAMARLMLPTIFLFGTALAAKYTVAQLFLLPWLLLIFLPLLVRAGVHRGAFAAGDHPWKWLLVGCLLAAVPCAAWFGKNLVWYGNPLEPFFQRLFRPDDAAAAAAEKFYIDSHFPQSPLSAGYWQTLLPRLREFGWLTLLAFAAGLIRWRTTKTIADDAAPTPCGAGRAAARFAGAAALAFLLWNTVRDSQNRFLLPLFVLLAAFAAVGAQRLPWRAVRRALVVALGLYAAMYAGKFALLVHEGNGLDYVLGFAPTSRDTDFSDDPEPAPREAFLAENLGDLGRIINQINRQVPADAIILLLYEARPYLFRPETLYNVVWDDAALLDLIRPAASADEAMDLLRRAGVTHVLVNRQELLRYIEQYARREQLQRLGIRPGQDPRGAWTKTTTPEDLYPPFYRDPDWPRLRPLVQEILQKLDSGATLREGQKPTPGVKTPLLDITLTPLG